MFSVKQKDVNYTNYSVYINISISCVAYGTEFEKSWPMAAEPSEV